MTNRTVLKVVTSLGCLLVTLFAGAPRTTAQGQSGTTLAASKTATGHTVRTYTWTITKSVTPAG